MDCLRVCDQAHLNWLLSANILLSKTTNLQTAVLRQQWNRRWNGHWQLIRAWYMQGKEPHLLKEHQQAVFSSESNMSALAEHAMTTDHEIDWPSAAVLDYCQFYHQRSYLESWLYSQAAKSPQMLGQRPLWLSKIGAVTVLAWYPVYYPTVWVHWNLVLWPDEKLVQCLVWTEPDFDVKALENPSDKFCNPCT